MIHTCGDLRLTDVVCIRSAYHLARFFFAVLRITITLACMMRLQRFPLDRQKCSIAMESCKTTSVSQTQLLHVWWYGKALSVSESMAKHRRLCWYIRFYIIFDNRNEMRICEYKPIMRVIIASTWSSVSILRVERHEFGSRYFGFMTQFSFTQQQVYFEAEGNRLNLQITLH